MFTIQLTACLVALTSLPASRLLVAAVSPESIAPWPAYPSPSRYTLDIGVMFDGSGTAQTNITTELMPTIYAQLIGQNFGSIPVHHTNQTVQLILHTRDSQCDNTVGLQQAMQLNQSYHLAAVIGPQCSVAASYTAMEAGLYNIPVISPSAMATSLADKTKFPTFMRNIGNVVSEANCIIATAQYFQIVKVAVIYSDNLYGQAFYAAMQQQAANTSITLMDKAFGLSNTASDADIRAALSAIVQAGVTSIALDFDTVPAIAHVLRVAYQMGISGKQASAAGYSWFAGTGILYESLYPELSVTAFGMITGNWQDLTLSEPYTSLYANAVDQWDGTAAILNSTTTYIADSITTLVQALTTLLNSNTSLSTSQAVAAVLANGQLLYTTMLNQSFYGCTGQVNYLSTGDRNPASQLFIMYVTTDQGPVQQIGSISNYQYAATIQQFLWPGNTYTVPATTLTVQTIQQDSPLLSSTYIPAVVLAVFVSFLGADLAAIVSEQIVFEARKTKGSKTGVLAFTVAALQGSVCVWAPQLLLILSVSYSTPPPKAPVLSLIVPAQPQTYYSISMIVLGLLVIFALTAASAVTLLVRAKGVLRGMHTDYSSTTSSETSDYGHSNTANNSTQQQVRVRKAEPQLAATKAPEQEDVSSIRRVIRFFQHALSLPLMLSAVLLTLAVVAGRQMLRYSAITLNVSVHTNAGAEIGFAVLTLAVIVAASAVSLHAKHGRKAHSILMAAAVVGTEWEAIGSLTSATYYCSSSGNDDRCTDTRWTGVWSSGQQASSTVLFIVASVFAAVIAVVFVQMLISRNQLSRNALVSVIQSMQSKMAMSQRQVKSLGGEKSALQSRLEAVYATLTHINLSRPIKRDYSGTLIQSSNWQQVWPLAAERGHNRIRGSANTESQKGSLHESVQVPGVVNAPAALASSGLTMSHVLNHPLLLELLKDVAAKKHNEENICFWLDVECYRRLTDVRLRYEVASGIIALFLAQTAANPLNVIASLRVEVLQAYRLSSSRSCAANLFDSIQHEVERLIANNDWIALQAAPELEYYLQLVNAARPQMLSPKHDVAWTIEVAMDFERAVVV